MKNIKLVKFVVVILLLFIMLLDFAPLAEGSTVTKTYTATADTMQLNGQAEYNGIYNHDGDGYLYVGMSNNDGFVNVRNRMATTFNLGAQSGTIVSAELVLTVATTLRSPNHTLYMEVRGSAANFLDHSFIGTFPNVDTNSPYTDKFTAKSTAEVPMGTYLQDKTITLNVKEAIDAFTNINDRNITFIINGNESDADSGRFLFYSLESSNAMFHPKLVITYETEPVNTPPTGSFTIVEGAMTRSSTVNLSVTGSDPDAGDSITHMRFANSVANLSAASWLPFSNTATFSLSGEDGSKTVYMQLRDSNNGVSSSISKTILLDMTAPTGTLSINDGAIWTKSDTVTLKGTYTDGSGSGVEQARLSNINGIWQTSWFNIADLNGFSWDLSVGEGAKTVYVQYKDKVGNMSSANISSMITVDRTAPIITGIVNNKAYNTKVNPVFNEGTATLNGSPFTSGTEVSSEGVYTLVVTDAAGNVTTINFQIDETPPSEPIITNPVNGSLFNHASPTISGKAEAFSTVNVFDNSIQLGTVTADGAGNWFYTTSGLADGSHSITAKVTDAAGNTSIASLLVNITIATNNSPTGITLSSSSVEENNPVNTLIGTLSATDPDAGDTFTYYLVAGTGDMDNSNFSISGNQLRANASFDYEVKNSYSIRVRVTDNGGLSFEKQFTISIHDVNENPVPNDATLTSLTVSEGALSPAFAPHTDTYTVSVDTTVSSIDITANPTDAHANVKINGNATTADTISLTIGQATSIPIVVTAQDGGQKTYTVIINPIPVTSTGLTVSPKTKSVTVGDTTAFTMIEQLSDGTTQNQTVNTTFTVSDATIATIQGHILTAIAPGTVTITATYGSSSDTATITVVNRKVPPVPQPTPQPEVPGPMPTPEANPTPVMMRVLENGEVHYRAALTRENFQTVISQRTGLSERAVHVVFPSETATLGATLTATSGTLDDLANQRTDLFIQTARTTIFVPHTSLNGFTKDLFFRIVPVKSDVREAIQENAQQNEQVQAFVGNKMTVNLLGNPITIETNMQNRPVTITLPIPTDATEAQVASLVVYIEHSDGTTEVKQGRIVEMTPGVQGIAFEVMHFSTFTLLYTTELVEAPKEKILKPYIQGYPDGTFKPNATVTRAQMATMLARHVTDGEIPTAEATFKDTKNIASKDAVEFVKQAGLFNGVTETIFNPNGMITRAQMAGIVARWMNTMCAEEASKTYCRKTSLERVFTDVSPTHWAAQAIEQVSALGIMTGNSATTFNPNGSLTRAQAVKVLNQLFERPTVEGITESMFWDVPASHWALEEIEAAAAEMITE